MSETALIAIITQLAGFVIAVGGWLNERAKRRTTQATAAMTALERARQELQAEKDAWRQELREELVDRDRRIAALEEDRKRQQEAYNRLHDEYISLWLYVRQLQNILREHNIPVPALEPLPPRPFS